MLSENSLILHLAAVSSRFQMNIQCKASALRLTCADKARVDELTIDRYHIIENCVHKLSLNKLFHSI